MNAIVNLLILPITISLLFYQTIYSQPNLEARVTLQLEGTQSVTSAVSNGHGQHVAATGGGDGPRHYLLANDGKVIYGPTSLGSAGDAGDYQCAVAAYGGKVMFVRRDVSAQSILQIRLYQSADGGASWPSNILEIFEPSVTVGRIDAVADANGVHIVWDNDIQTEVYYVRYVESTDEFKDFKNVTDEVISGLTGKIPKIVTVGNKAVISFVRTDANVINFVGASRDVDLSVAPPSWEYPRWTAADNNYDIETQSVAKLNNDIHMVVYEQNGSGFPREINASQRVVTGDWTTPVNVDNYGVTGEHGNHRRKIVSTSTNLYMAYADRNGSLYQINLRTYDPVTGWTIFNLLDEGTNRQYPTISSSRTGVYTYWAISSFVDRYMLRKVLTISGNVSENMFWTANNWITGDTYIENGYAVTMKSSSPGTATTIQAGKKLYVRAGGKLIVESGAELVMESGAQIILESGSPAGGILELADNAVVTVPHSAILEAQPGTQLKFGNGAQLKIEGELKALGTGTGGTQRVLFTRIDPSDVWNGIIIERPGGAPKGTFTYATIQHVSGDALRVGSNAIFSMNNCTISNALVGVEFTQAIPPLGAPTNVIQNSTITVTGTTAKGILSTNYSNFILDGNTISATSAGGVNAGILLYASNPQIVRNTISNVGRGLQSMNGSSPVVGGSTATTNLIYGLNIGAYCKNASNPVLGSGNPGGRNCIYATNPGYDVWLEENCQVMAENNYWNGLEFSIGTGCTLDSDYSLDDCFPAGGRSAGGENPYLILMPTSLQLAIEKRAQGNYREAITLLQEVIPDEGIELSAREWAISELTACVQSMPGSTISSYLESVLTTSPELERRIDLLLPHLYLHEGRTESATIAFDANIRQYPDSELERDGLYGKFLNDLYTSRDPLAAEAALGSLQMLYPESDELSVAELQLENYVRSSDTSWTRGESISPVIQPTLTVNLDIPVEFSLSQNYPNPFNPSTTIQYALPEAAKVSLKLYDILGREILTLVEGVQEAGYHQVTLDGRNLASGMYFYRITAGSFADSKKLLIVK